LIALADTIKPEAQKVVHQLHKMGIEVAMVTGDNNRTAEAIARQAASTGFLRSPAGKQSRRSEKTAG